MNDRLLRRVVSALVLFALIGATSSGFAAVQSATYRGTMEIVRYDVSPALKDIPEVPIPLNLQDWGGLIADPAGSDNPKYGKQTPDQAVQKAGPTQDIPDPVVNFDATPNVAGFSPPDPVGDIGPNHYVVMSNVHFEIYNRAGTSLFGPAANNTLWAGFGGPCQTQNAGDPIVLYDQFVDRWILTQFTSTAEAGTGLFYNCVAVSMTSDPLGNYHRYQISNGTVFPDYPKFGVGEDAYYISTRDFNGGAYSSIGAFAMNKQDLINGVFNANTVIGFLVDRSIPENVGDGILPMDIDGDTLPPVDSPHYFVGTMDDGGPYGAAQDAMTVWEFVVDFVTPANSSFTLTDIVPIADYDTIFPCSGRNCIDQPDTTVGLDHQGYRQRPLHRAAYRNFGTHEAIVTNQSVEADNAISGIRWWELRDPGGVPTIHQEGTFAPGVEDGIHRWFGSAAMDSAGNIGLGYSAGSETVYPSIRYSGRLFTDESGAMLQGEGEFVAGTGSQTSTGSRWGDYTSLNVDPLDDCTFWYVNEYVPVTSTAGWQLRVGAFKFDECGESGFAMSPASPPEVLICAGDDANWDLNLGSIEGFTDPVSLSATGNPGGTSTGFSVNPVSLPGTSTLTISGTGGVADGNYPIEVTGTAAGVDNRVVNLSLDVVAAEPGQSTLLTPADSAIDTALNPTFTWTDVGADDYTIEVATDPGFSNIVISETVNTTEFTPFEFLSSGATYYWRVRGNNACGPSVNSAVFSFTTMSLPGDCPAGQATVVAQLFDFESGAQGWTSGSNLGPNTWALSGANPNSGAQHWHVNDVDEPSDTFLTSPSVSIPNGLGNLTFRFFNFQNFEAPGGPDECWDGGMLEVSTNGGANFVEVTNGDLLTDPYDGALRADSDNPLGNRQAWCGAPQPYLDSRVDISGLAGENDVVFRFRVGTDVAAGAPGWDIDDVAIVGCSTVLEFDHGFENGDAPPER